MVRVLLVAPPMQIVGGQAVQAYLLISAFQQAPSVRIRFLAANPQLPGLFGRLQRRKYVRTFLTVAAYLATLAAAVPKCDVVHVFSPSYYAFLLVTVPAILAGRLAGKKVIVHYHSGEAEDHLSNWRTALPLLRLAHALVAPSGYLRDVFARFGLSCRVVPNIIETGRFLYRVRDPLRPVFLANRAFEPLYNVACVVRAFALIQQAYPQACLRLAHDGPLRAKVTRLAADLGLRQVEFLGRVPYAQMGALYDSADIYLNASNLDCLPGSIVECYASGLPVVTTDAGGIPYMLRHGETGWLVRRNDPQALAEGALALLRSPETARRMTENARQECRHYQADAVREQWTALYQELATLAGRL